MSSASNRLRTRGGDKARTELSTANPELTLSGNSTLKRLASSNDSALAEATPESVGSTVQEPNKRARLSSPHPDPGTDAQHSASEDTEHTITTPSSASGDGGTSFTSVDHVDAAAIERANVLVNMCDSTNGRYNITNLPLTAKWGTKYDTEKYLCDKGNRKLTVWVVGVVKSAWFVNSAGEPVPHVNVAVRPSRAVDLEALHTLIGRSSPAPDKLPDRASASRFQTRKVKGSAVPQAYPFDRIYNATEKFKAKSLMTKIPPHRVGNGDFVLVEGFVNRYKTNNDGKGWTSWNVTLELNDLSVVYEAPDGFVDVEDDPPSMEIDDDI